MTVQEIWLPYDHLDYRGDKTFGDLPKTLHPWADPAVDPVDPTHGAGDVRRYDLPTPDQIDALHAPSFAKMDECCQAINKKIGRADPVIEVVPVGQAMNALRRRIVAGTAPGILKQSALFADVIGHPKAAIMALSAYCHFAVIYHRSPVGLKNLPVLEREHLPEALNSLLQELAWSAVTGHPLSGVHAQR